MNSWRCDSPTGIEGLRWVEGPVPEPRPGEARVAIEAASLNFPDLLIVQGKYQAKPTPPFVPGAEFAGIVEAVGPGVTTVRVGQRVMTVVVHGGFATHACVAAPMLRPRPEGMPCTEAAAFLMTYGTSYHALMDHGALCADETVLVLGAAGGVGTAAVQVAKAAGARVIAAVLTEEKAVLCQQIGADATINYGAVDLRDAIKAATDGRGPDIIYDPVGGDLAEPAFRSIGWRGRYLVVGFAGGRIPSLPLNLPLLKSASIVGVFWGGFDQREPDASARAVAELARWYEAGKIKPIVDRVLPMDKLPTAYALMASCEVLGKIVFVNEPQMRGEK